VGFDSPKAANKASEHGGKSMRFRGGAPKLMARQKFAQTADAAFSEKRFVIFH